MRWALNGEPWWAQTVWSVASTLRTELDAACTLLASSGTDVSVVIEGEPTLATTDEIVRSQLRAELSRLLREVPAHCAIVVTETDAGARLRVTSLPDSKRPGSSGSRR